MKYFFVAILLAFFCIPCFARPFQYNLAYGPEYFYFTSTNLNTRANLVTCGLVLCGNIYNNFNLEFRGAVGEISTTKMNYNELSLLYTPVNTPNSSIGYGITFLNYNNILDKNTNVSIDFQAFNAKLQCAHYFAPLRGFYLSLIGPNAWSYELGWLTYFGERNGDFNIRLGYKALRLTNNSTMCGPYIASSIYF